MAKSKRISLKTYFKRANNIEKALAIALNAICSNAGRSGYALETVATERIEELLGDDEYSRILDIGDEMDDIE